MVVDQLPRLGKRELIFLLLFTCNYVVFVWRGFLLLWVLGMDYVILLWHSLSLPYNYFTLFKDCTYTVYLIILYECNNSSSPEIVLTQYILLFFMSATIAVVQRSYLHSRFYYSLRVQ